MTYQAIDELSSDRVFAGRVRACTTQEALVFRDDARPAFVALAEDVLRGGGATTLAFVRLVAAAPGVTQPMGSDEGPAQAAITDAEILASVQANWERVALLYWDETGNRLEL